MELFVCDEPPLEELAVVELWPDALLLPPGWVEVEEPVEVVVPADDPEAEPV